MSEGMEVDVVLTDKVRFKDRLHSFPALDTLKKLPSLTSVYSGSGSWIGV